MDIVIGGKNLNKVIRDLKNHIEGKSFQELLENKDFFFTNIMNYEELFDFDYDFISGTIHNEDGKAKLGVSFDVWSDYDCTVLFTFEIEE